MWPQRRVQSSSYCYTSWKVQDHICSIVRDTPSDTSSSLSLYLDKHQSFRKNFWFQLFAYYGGWQLLSQHIPTNEPIILMKAVIIHILSLLRDYFYSVQCLLSFLGMHSLSIFLPKVKSFFFFSHSHLPVRFVLFLIFEFKPDLFYSVTMLDESLFY